MAVLIACEESQTVTIEMRKLGIEAYSCDIQPCSGGHPEWHLQQNILELLDREWDLMIAHPPCTYLSKAGARWLYGGGKINQERLNKGLLGRQFFLSLLNSNIKRIAIENPTPMKIFELPAYSQVIQPYMFGDPYSKRTLLWLKNLPNLIPTNILDDYGVYMPSNTGGAKRGQKHTSRSMSQKQASKTFLGIAIAMSEQWGKLIN